MKCVIVLLLLAVWAQCVASLPPQLRRRDGPPKYFHEPGGSELLAHYDSRFYKFTVKEEERKETLENLVRAYLKFFDEERLETWIAHGTLLGWWWNGKILPWDWDLDVQVTHQTLLYIGEHLNNTITNFKTESGQKRRYLLDVNPESRTIDRGNGKNIIDARFIDTDNGLYIDITGLHETDPVNKPGIIECKNHHEYKLSDIFPLRRSNFEGVTAWIPYEYTKILNDEYPKGLSSAHYYNHDWDLATQTWVPNQKYNEEAAERDADAQRLREKLQKEKENKKKDKKED